MYRFILIAALISVVAAFTTPLPQQYDVSKLSSSAVLMSEESVEAASGSETEEAPIAVKCPNCDECDGSGRILGGIGVVLPWWPIKAYRPCPKFIENGGKYIRSGQALDEIAFGRDSTFGEKEGSGLDDY
mmetsp:Transcript_33520/g.47618  ORF Transcript_33520/g.47618 Transcript_33520/m.47618 type:complete len:130 (-) Transcript_33520:1007-1396(-)